MLQHKRVKVLCRTAYMAFARGVEGFLSARARARLPRHLILRRIEVISFAEKGFYMPRTRAFLATSCHLTKTVLLTSFCRPCWPSQGASVDST